MAQKKKIRKVAKKVKKKAIKIKTSAKKKIINRKASKPSIAIKKIQAPIHYEPPVIPTYEETLLKSIMSQGKKNKDIKTTEYSLLFNSVLSTLTPGLRNLYYKNGVSVGRSLYRIYHNEKRYTWYEESVSDLVAFLEQAGFSGITYNVFPDGIDFRFHNRDRTNLGTTIHVFEAGIICGFLTAGKQQHVKVDEVACSNNGSDSCHFITSTNLPLYLEPNGYEVLNKFAKSIKPHILGSGKEAELKSNFPDEYSILSSTVFLESEYSEHMNKVVYHLGSEIASSLNLSKLNKATSSKALEKLYKLLNLGNLNVKSLRPLAIEIQFDRLKSKKEFVDISIAFLNGLLKDTIRKDSSIKTNTSKRKNSYIVRISESKK
jgi:predicted hydrocarbon binding protein